MGLHPWYIDALHWQEQLEQLSHYSTGSRVVAIGECGLDKVCTTAFSLQQEVFGRQISLANTIGKPLLIHCVRAFAEVQWWLQKNKVQVPVIFHGFAKSTTLAQQLISKGYYLSLGKALQLPAVQQLLRAIPLQQVFFETDDSTIGIEKIYALAANALQIDVNTLSLQIKKNAAAVFGSPAILHS